VAMRSNLREDIYAVFAGVSEETGKAVIQFYLNPLVTWIWIGGIVMLAGTVICIFPDLKRARLERGRKALDRLLATAGKK